uniref:Glycine N-acyltransferase-like protein n=2 Tax=Arion vulgaris TaxID=1028688 RepID=A0A0B6ZQH6_9EUPU
MVEIHQVSEHELPILLQWLKEHLPLTWKLYGTLREQLRGKWQGTTFCTLGWPDILAVGEGPINEDICKVVGHYTDPRRTTVFAPEPAHARDFLTWPGFIDWSQPVIFHMLSLPVASIIKTLSQQAGCPSPKTIPLTLLTANSGDIKYRPREHGDVTIRRLDPDRDTEFVLANWEYAGKHTRSYIHELLKCFPSLGVFSRDGTCLGAEMGTEWGFIGMLYVTSSARGRGLGKLLTCRLAEKYFEEDLPAVVVTSVDNTESICLHESLGFQQECQLNLMYHTPDNINK